MPAVTLRNAWSVRFSLADRREGSEAVKRHRVVAAAVIKDEMWLIDRWLQRTSECADAIVIVDDGSTDGTLERLQEHPSVAAVSANRPGSPRHELRNYETRLRLAQELDPEWILFLDADEIMDARLPGVLGDLCSRSGAGRYCFREVTLWRGADRYRIDRPDLYGRILDTSPILVRNAPSLKVVSTRGRKRRVRDALTRNRYFVGGMGTAGFAGETVELLDLVKLHYHFVDWERAWRHQIAYAVWRSREEGRFGHPVDEIVEWASGRMNEEGLRCAPVRPEWGVLA